MIGTLPQLPYNIRGVQKDSYTFTFTLRHVTCQTQPSVLAVRTGLDIVSGQLHHRLQVARSAPYFSKN